VETKMAQSLKNNPNPVHNVDSQALLDENRALKDEIQKLRERLEEDPEELQHAVRNGDLDALVVPSTKGEMTFTLNSVDQTYHIPVELANDDVVIVDPEFKIIYVGNRLAHKAGYSQEEVIGRSILDFADKKCTTLTESNMDRRKQGMDDVYEFKLIRKDGSPLWVLINSRPLFNDGVFKGSLAMLTDITEIKQTEMALQKAYGNIRLQSAQLHTQYEALQFQYGEIRDAHEAVSNSEKKYRNIVETANEGIFVFNSDILVTYANNKMAEMLGYVPEEMIGKHGTDFVDNEYKKYTELRTEKRKQGIDEVHENKLVCKDGSTLWTLVNSKSLFDKAGKFTGVLVMLTDITDRKVAEEERERLLDQIQQEKDRLSALLNSITDEVWFADSQKKISLVNPPVLNEFGINAEEDIGVEEFFYSLEVYRPDGTLRPVEEAPPLRALQGEIVKNHEEIIRTPVHGELRYRQANAAPVRDISGNIVGSVVVVRDITDLKQIEAKLREAYEKLQVQSEELQVANEELRVSYSNLMGFQSQEKYNCFSIHPYSHLGEKNGS